MFELLGVRVIEGYSYVSSVEGSGGMPNLFELARVQVIACSSYRDFIVLLEIRAMEAISQRSCCLKLLPKISQRQEAPLFSRQFTTWDAFIHRKANFSYIFFFQRPYCAQQSLLLFRLIPKSSALIPSNPQKSASLQHPLPTCISPKQLLSLFYQGFATE